jgi:DNA processing protein
LRVQDDAGWPAGFADGTDGRRDLVRLACMRGMTPRTLHRLAWDVGTATACVGAVRRGDAGSEMDRTWIERADPDDVLSAAEACGARFLAFGEPGFPAELADLLHDPPGWLFVRGRPLRSGGFRVAVVGARRCSALGRDVAHDIGRRLAGVGVAVVSGAASGIDAAAHRGALAAPGPTVAVLGSGIDVAYPASSRGLLEEIARSGTVVSEYPPGTPAEPYHFPSRNRIVAALGEALVVVEGACKSGSRISVDHALDLGRDVYAVPGPVTSPLSETPLEIIREGATMIRGAEDLLADLGVADRTAERPPLDLPEHERRAYGALAAPCLPDAVARLADLAIPEALTALLGLELRGLVRVNAGRYERTLRASSDQGEGTTGS